MNVKMSEQWMQTYDAVFFVSVGTLVIGFLGLVIKYCLKSKCENVRLCFGMIEIHRRVDLETEVELHEIDASAIDSPPDLEASVSEVKTHQPPRRPKTGRLDLVKSTPVPKHRDPVLTSQSPQAATYQEVQSDHPSHSE